MPDINSVVDEAQPNTNLVMDESQPDTHSVVDESQLRYYPAFTLVTHFVRS
jgi:hypothetical protein